MFDFVSADWVATCRTTPTEPSASDAICPDHTTVSALAALPCDPVNNTTDDDITHMTVTDCPTSARNN